MICGHGLTAEPIYLVTPTGRRVIAQIAWDAKCSKPKGDVLKEPNCPESFNETTWQAMLKHRKDPPFYVVERGGLILPEGYKTEAE